MHHLRITLALLASLSAVILSSLSASAAEAGSAAPAQMSLYERLGGTDAIAAVTDRFVDVLTTDPRIGKNAVVVEHLGKHTVAGIKFQVTAFIIQVTGGPLVYHGNDMETAHKGLMITEDEWNASAEDLIMVFNEFKLPQALQDEVLALVSTTKGDIVGQ